MFGIGLPELILILGIALIVVGPERLPELAKSLAKGINELKKTATALKESMDEELKDETTAPWHQNPDSTTPSPELPGVNTPPAQNDEPEVTPESAAPDTTPSIPESVAPPSPKP